MDYSKKQQELDVTKWVDSEIKNYDTCGEYSYCNNCNKNSSYPCAYAYEKYINAAKVTNTLTSKGTTKTTKTIKTSTCAKKTTAKKTSTTKRSTKVAA